MNTSYYEIYFGLFNFDGLGLNRDLFRFYIAGLRTDFGFNTLRTDSVNLRVEDYFNQSLYDRTVYLRNYTEYNLYVEVWNLIINSNYSWNVRMEIERNAITITQIIPPQ